MQRLNSSEKEQLRAVLDDIHLSKEQQQIVLARQQAYKGGDIAAYSLEELKVFINYSEE